MNGLITLFHATLRAKRAFWRAIWLIHTVTSPADYGYVTMSQADVVLSWIDGWKSIYFPVLSECY